MRYYFSVCSAGQRIRDTEGSDCADLAAAYLEAIESGRTILSDWIRCGRPLLPGDGIEILDEFGVVVGSVELDRIVFGLAREKNIRSGDPSQPESALRDGVQSAIDALLAECIDVCSASLGNVQLMNWDIGRLKIRAQNGFSSEFLNFFEAVTIDDGCACAQALRTGNSVIIEDIELNDGFRDCGEIMRRAGVRAVQSTPLISSSGVFIGVVSTHFTGVHRPTDGQIRGVCDAATRTANAVVRLRASAEAL